MKQKIDRIGRKEIVEGSKHRRRQNKPDTSMDMSPMWSLSSYKKRDFEMNIRNRKAIVSNDGRYITVLGKDGKEWRLCPASFCTWAAGDPKKREVLGFGGTVWEAIQEAEKEIKK